MSINFKNYLLKDWLWRYITTLVITITVLQKKNQYVLKTKGYQNLKFQQKFLGNKELNE